MGFVTRQCFRSALVLVGMMMVASAAQTVESSSTVWVMPYLPRAGPLQGLVSFENRGEMAVEGALEVYDDYGTLVAQGSVSLPPGYIRWVRTDAMEQDRTSGWLRITPGSKARGYVLWATMALPPTTTVLAYVRAREGGFMAPMSRTAFTWRSARNGRWSARVPFLHASSELRILNPTQRERTVRLSARDNQGVEGDNTIVCTVAALGAIRLRTRALEENPDSGYLREGECSSRGWGDGIGNWRVNIEDAHSREEPLVAMALMRNRNGLVTNASYPVLTVVGEVREPSAEPIDPPEDSAVFYARVRGKKFSLTFSDGPAAGETPYLRFTSYYHSPPYTRDHGRVSASTSADNDRGRWTYTTQGEQRALLELNFGIRGLGRDSVYGQCQLEALFTELEEGRFLSECDTTGTGRLLGGTGTFEIQDLF